MLESDVVAGFVFMAMWAVFMLIGWLVADFVKNVRLRREMRRRVSSARSFYGFEPGE